MSTRYALEEMADLPELRPSTLNAIIRQDSGQNMYRLFLGAAVAKNIVIFSDGTGQGGGLLPDKNRSNVYQLFRAAWVCTNTTISPAKQVAFHEVGLDSKAAGSDIKIGWWRQIYNILSSATGLGITQNITGCYAAILRVWKPGDWIYLIGFSRGAYTVRCLGAALALCGVPTQDRAGTHPWP